MGAYLSEPITDKISTDEKNDALSYGASSMQGWRLTQEDAHNAILDFDKDTSFFAVYDGHGGEEVSKYAADNLPSYIKESKYYQSQDCDFEECLRQVFLNFDLSLIEPSVLSKIQEIAKSKDGVSEEEDPVAEREEIENLKKDASMPIEKVIQLYGEKKVISPNLRSKKELLGEGSSSSGVPKLDMSTSSLDASENNSPEEASINVAPHSNGDLHEKSVKTDLKDDAVLVNGDEKLPDSIDDSVKKKPGGSSESNTQHKTNNEIKDNSNSNNCTDTLVKEENNQNSNVKRETINNDISNSEDAPMSSNNENSTESNDSKMEHSEDAHEVVQPRKGGKGSGHSKGKNIVSHTQILALKQAQRATLKRAAAQKGASIYSKMCQGDVLTESDEYDSEDSEEEDEAVDIDTESTEDEAMDGEEEEISDEEEEEDDDDEDEEGGCGLAEMGCEEPCYDSGCTACVAVIRNDKLYVANVGDSRCVLYRGGEAIDMSVDHKPEDDIETERIVKAGGQITEDGRVNGGLNLSRALGDHRYKMNTKVKQEEQMISALPDIQTAQLSDEDEFLIIACDGIWNSLTSLEASSFVSQRIKEGTKLSTICEQLFDCCIAPNTEGDGTGCDNMTCIIVKFHNKKIVDSSSSIKKNSSDSLATDSSSSIKRRVEESPESSQSKKAKLESS